MFKDNQPIQNEVESVIGPSVRVEGDFITEGNMVIEGIVSGTIKTNKNLKVGTKSKIFADVEAENAIVSGEIQGSIKVTNKLELTSSAKIFGDIKAEILIIAAGSKLNGKCQMSNNKDKTNKPDFSKQGKINLEEKKLEEKKEDKKEEKKKPAKK